MRRVNILIAIVAIQSWVRMVSRSKATSITVTIAIVAIPVTVLVWRGSTAVAVAIAILAWRRSVTISIAIRSDNTVTTAIIASITSNFLL